MRKYLTVLASFIIMLCIGSVYAWSIIASELMEEFNFTASQTQIVFGTLIAIFPLTMVFVGRLGVKFKHKYFGYISGIFYFSGYYLAGYSQGNYILILLGVGVMAGIATGFGYWVALTTPVQWFPEKKGFITGIAAAGFGLGAVFMSEISEAMLSRGFSILQLLKLVGISYGLIIFISSTLIYQVRNKSGESEESPGISFFMRTLLFRKLFLGLFLGTFAGLLIIGSLSMIGEQYNITNHILVTGIALFAVANFAGRLFWGFFSDRVGASLSIFLTLLLQSASIVSLNIFALSVNSYLIISLLTGFGFGGNFVLFAKETAQEFGVKNIGVIYPYVFIGYAIAGIAGPVSGGFLYDYTGSFSFAIYLAGFMSLAGGLLFLNQFLATKKQ
jgi:MFS transporter, OFA family, oxalate/formate antiporter